MRKFRDEVDFCICKDVSRLSDGVRGERVVGGQSLLIEVLPFENLRPHLFVSCIEGLRIVVPKPADHVRIFRFLGTL